MPAVARRSIQKPAPARSTPSSGSAHSALGRRCAAPSPGARNTESRIASTEMVEIGAGGRWSSDGCATVDLRSPPASTEDAMTDDRRALIDLLQKSEDG